MDYTLTTNSVTHPGDIYSELQTGSSQNINILGQCLLPLALVATVATSSATMPTPNRVFSSTVAGKDIIQIRNNNQTNISKQEAIAMFATEWQRKSVSLSAEDSKLWEEIIASKSEPGFPDF